MEEVYSNTRFFFYFVGVYQHVNPCGSFCVLSQRKGEEIEKIREKKKRDRRDSGGDEREGQGRKRKMNASEETEEIKTTPLYPYLLQG